MRFIPTSRGVSYHMHFVAMRALVIPFSLVVLGLASQACRDVVSVCTVTAVVRLTTPDTTTIKVGASTIAIAGEQIEPCRAPPARDYLWRISDSTFISVEAFDSIYARIRGIRPGTATVTPTYRTSGIAVSSVHVTVVP